jgi:hypothetical protein
VCGTGALQPDGKTTKQAQGHALRRASLDDPKRFLLNVVMHVGFWLLTLDTM